MAASLQFSLANVIECDIKQKHIYSVKFCSILPTFKKYFAAVGMNFAAIYRIGETAGEVELEQAYTDPDDMENYYVRRLAYNPIIFGSTTQFCTWFTLCDILSVC